MSDFILLMSRSVGQKLHSTVRLWIWPNRTVEIHLVSSISQQPWFCLLVPHPTAFTLWPSRKTCADLCPRQIPDSLSLACQFTCTKDFYCQSPCHIAFLQGKDRSSDTNALLDLQRIYNPLTCTCTHLLIPPFVAAAALSALHTIPLKTCALFPALALRPRWSIHIYWLNESANEWINSDQTGVQRPVCVNIILHIRLTSNGNFYSSHTVGIGDWLNGTELLNALSEKLSF